MKKIIVLAAFVCALGALATRPQAEVSRQAAAEPMQMLALMAVPQSLPVEAYQAI
jgi:hypothetical protein